VTSISGPYADALLQMERNLNFTTELRMRKDGKWGSKSSDGSWTGMISDLMRGRIHLTVAPMYMTASRLAVVDFLFPRG